VQVAVSGRKLGTPSGKQSLHSLNIRSTDILIKVNIFQLFKEVDISGKKIGFALSLRTHQMA
jgi:hypothetical protein